MTITGHEEEVDNVSGSGFATDLVAAISGMSVLFGTPRHEYGYTATWHLHLKRADGAVTESAGKSKQTVLCTISDDKAKLKARNKARDEALKTALLGLKADAAFRLVAGSR